tara:strand:- start:244 stop:1005 length:762 start_codon:yes stop_codon:yes gene_type:complete
MLKLSVSSIGTYEKCPKQYHYRYIEKPDVIRQKHPATEFGSCAHLALEIFHKVLMKKNIDSSEYPRLMKWATGKAIKEFDLSILKEPTWTTNGEIPGIIFLKEVLQDYLNVIRSQGLPNVIGVEVPYSFKVGDSTIRGYIDRLDKVCDGEYRVVDYKTSKNPKYLTEFQLLVYADAIRRKYPDAKIIHGSYMMLKHSCKTKDWVFNSSDFNRVTKKLLKRAGQINSETRWVKKPSVLCNWCDYKTICQDSWAE